jgi:hypothetical protein
VIPRALDRDVERAGGDLVAPDHLDPPRREPRQLRPVASDDLEPAPRQGQRLRHELPELTVADHEHPIVRCDAHLLLDLQRRGKRLDEHGGVIGDGSGDGVEILDLEREVLRERPVAIHDAEHGTALAMGAASGRTGATTTAHGVDLAHDRCPWSSAAPRSTTPTNSWPSTPV